MFSSEILHLELSSNHLETISAKEMNVHQN